MASTNVSIPEGAASLGPPPSSNPRDYIRGFNFGISAGFLFSGLGAAGVASWAWQLGSPGNSSNAKYLSSRGRLLFISVPLSLISLYGGTVFAFHELPALDQSRAQLNYRLSLARLTDHERETKLQRRIAAANPPNSNTSAPPPRTNGAASAAAAAAATPTAATHTATTNAIAIAAANNQKEIDELFATGDE